MIGNDYRCWARLRPGLDLALPLERTELLHWTAGARRGGVVLCLMFSLEHGTHGGTTEL